MSMRKEERRREVESQRARQHGPALLMTLASLLGVAEVTGAQGDTPDPAVALSRIVTALRPFGGTIKLEVRDGTTVVDGERLRVGGAIARALATELSKRGLASITVQAPMTAEEARDLPRALAAARKQETRKSAKPRPASGQRPVAAVASKAESERTWLMPSVRAYLNTVAVLQETRSRVSRRDQLPLRAAKRAMHAIARAMARNENRLLALTSVRGLAEGAEANRVNAALLALAVGQRIGLDARSLSELGVAVLFLDGTQPAEHRATARSLLRSQAAGDTTARCLRTVTELAGPAEERSLMTQIAHVCSSYQAKATANGDGPDGPLAALRELLSDREHPTVAKLLAEVLGPYPMGTVVQLTSGELATVLEENRSDPARPKVKLFADNQGRPTTGVLDLAETSTDPDSLAILRIADSSLLGLRTEEHLAVL